MRKCAAFFGAILLSFSFLAAQEQPVRLKLHVVLVDKDLNLKPVPRFSIALRSVGSTAEKITALKTGLDGMVETELPAGKYQVSTPEPIDFQGKKYSWQFEITLSPPRQTIELSNDNAVVTAGTAVGTAVGAAGGDELTALFQRLQNSVVTVRSESADGTGFLVDAKGLVITNEHIIGKSPYVAVQFDRERKVLARLLASDASKDIAVLWANPSVFPKAVFSSIAEAQQGKAPVVEGERVFTIGNPFGREKTLTLGVVSKIEEHDIISDVSINPGNSGGPLFNFRGSVVGITTAGRQRLSRIIRIEDAVPLLQQAKGKMSGQEPPSATLLPVEPADYFPAQHLATIVRLEEMDVKPYAFDAGEYHVRISTPPVRFWLSHNEELKAARKKAKRTGENGQDAASTAEILSEAQHYKPVIIIQASPKFSQFFKVKYKTDFQKMRLMCGAKVVEPIDPGRTERVLRKPNGDVTDQTYQGLYTYPPDAISPNCGQVVLQIYSENNPQEAVKVLESTTVTRVWSDFEPYRKLHQ